MKKRLIDIVIAFMFGLSILLFIGAYTRSWTESTPTDATVANQIDNFNRYLRVDVAERVEDYIAGFNASDSNEGFYRILFIEQTSFSTPAANKYVIGGKLIDSKCELVGKDEDGDEIQLSYTGKHMIGSGTAPQAFMYNTTEEDTDGGRESTIRAKGEQSGGEVTTLGYIEFSHDGTSDDEKGRYRIMLNDGDDTDAPSKCPIEYASDGTIDVTNSISVVDEDDMASDSNTVVATQQSIKKYVDDQILAQIPLLARARGWVTFDGTNADPDSTKTGYNVASITDHGTGEWSVNWDTDFASSAYATVVSTNNAHSTLISQAAGAVRVKSINAAGNAADASIVSVIVFGSQ